MEEHLRDVRRRQERIRPADTPAEVAYPAGEISLPAHVEHWARERPDRPALAFAGAEMSYAELADRVAAVAGWLEGAGVRPGDRVAVLLPNCPQFVIAFLAILRAGAVHVPVNPMFKAAELTHELTDCGARVVITLDTLLPLVEEVAGALGPDHRLDRCLVTAATEMAAVGGEPALGAGAGVEVVAWRDAVSHPPGTDRSGDLDALAALNYTSGTTGLPKGCEHTQRHMLYTAASAIGATGFADSPSYAALCYLPIFWIAGEDLGILNPIVAGGTSILMARWDAGEALRLLERYAVGVLVGTVENYLELLGRDELASTDLSALRLPMAISFVQVLTPEVRVAWREAVGAHSVLREAAYGMTETHTFDVTPYGFDAGDADLVAEPIFCGLPVPGTDVAVVEPGTLSPVPLGEVGEIVVRSPSVMTGYWRRPDATAGQLRDGWLMTGDNGRLDEDGCLHFLGRAKDMIKVNGMSVFPAEVEMLLTGHPDVEVAAVVPTEDAARGQCPVAFVSLRDGAAIDAERLETWARANMATYKVPRVVVVGEFPMTDTGKIRKVELVERARTLGMSRG
ncbi:AMP-binding protein [Nocardioides ultimimeridianus]